ncbi:MAG: hypothetical protein RLZZ488_2274 [Pseudomonadota bacterium]|jgi:hypothetical protein
MVSCTPNGDDTLGGNGTICQIELTRSQQNLNFDGETTVSYTGPLSSDCQRKTTELSGRAQINVAAQSQVSSASISLQELKAGQRNLQFDSNSDNFLRGSYEKRFDSSFYPEWSLPWSDRPTIVTLSMSLSDAALTSALPATVKVELLY